MHSRSVESAAGFIKIFLGWRGPSLDACDASLAGYDGSDQLRQSAERGAKGMGEWEWVRLLLVACG